MARRSTAFVLLSVLAFAGLLFLLRVGVQAEVPQEEPGAPEQSAVSADAQYPLSGRILTRTLSDGRIELCFLPAGREIICPQSRFLNPSSAQTDRWALSSEIEWRVPIDPNLVQVSRPPQPEAGGCQLDFERMFAATWKVETTKWRGTAFHIGSGRFVTAHHVIDDVPPYLTLTHGDRSLAAGVLGSNPELDVALLEVFDPSLINDVPAVEFRNPTGDDVGAPIYLVGYPSAGALTAATGAITRVWDDEIQTDSSAQGGNSGGPMFDACGDVLGVLWAGSSSTNFSHSGHVLQEAISRLPKRRPPIVGGAPDWLTPPGVVVWHYAAAPPEGVDCVGVEGNWWIGIAGLDWWQVDNGLVDDTGKCSYGLTSVIALESRPQQGGDPACIERYGSSGDGEILSVLHESREEFGRVRLLTLSATTRCPWRFTHKVIVELLEPRAISTTFAADLIGADGSRIDGDWSGRSYRSAEDAVADAHGNKPYGTFAQAWEVPRGFEVARVRLSVGASTWMIDVVPPPGPHVRVAARIAAHPNADGSVTACLRLADGARRCPAGEPTRVTRHGVRWTGSGLVDWFAPLQAEELGSVEPQAATCALDLAVGDVPWQITALGESGSAVYVGRNQFLTSNRLFSDATPWAVVARHDVAYPAIRVAVDRRDGLALVQVIGGSVGDAEIVRFSRATDDAEARDPVLVGFPWGDANRFAMTRLRVSAVTERLIRHDGWGWDRAGAPLVDPCNREIAGIATGSNEALRAETVIDSLSDLRRRARVPAASARGPRLHGSIALLPLPVYLGTEQPDFGGWICHVRPSERYEVVYAVYLVSDSRPSVIGAVDGAREYISRCGWNDKIFVVEYRSDQAPDAICAEPAIPARLPSTLALDLDAPDGVELLHAGAFQRSNCPALPDQHGWASTHIAALRVTEGVEFDDLEIKLETDDGASWSEVASLRDVDPDVISYRFDVKSGEPARIVVTLRDGAGSGSEASEPAHVESTDDEAPQAACQELHDGLGGPVFAETLHESAGRFGTAMLYRYAAPYRCPWRHTHGIVVLFENPQAEGRLSASLFGADGRVVAGEWPGRLYRGTTDDPGAPTAEFTQSWEVPEDFEPVAYEIVVGGRRWIAVLTGQP